MYNIYAVIFIAFVVFLDFMGDFVTIIRGKQTKYKIWISSSVIELWGAKHVFVYLSDCFSGWNSFRRGICRKWTDRFQNGGNQSSWVV